MSTRVDVSQSLDVLTDQPGAVLVRDAQYWVVLPPGPVGQVITSNGPGVPPTYAPVPGGVVPGRVEQALSQGIPPGVNTLLTFATTAFDPLGAWDGPNNQWVIPIDVTRANFTLNSRAAAPGAAGVESIFVAINAVIVASQSDPTGVSLDFSMSTGPITVAPGDVVTGNAFSQFARNTLAGPRTSFTFEAIG